jgi:hypothetical protein
MSSTFEVDIYTTSKGDHGANLEVQEEGLEA